MRVQIHRTSRVVPAAIEAATDGATLELGSDDTFGADGSGNRFELERSFAEVGNLNQAGDRRARRSSFTVSFQGEEEFAAS